MLDDCSQIKMRSFRISPDPLLRRFYKTQRPIRPAIVKGYWVLIEIEYLEKQFQRKKECAKEIPSKSYKRKQIKWNEIAFSLNLSVFKAFMSKLAALYLLPHLCNVIIVIIRRFLCLLWSDSGEKVRPEWYGNAHSKLTTSRSCHKHV